MSNELTNLPERSVSELSNALKRTVEDTFGRVRVRGEISGLKIHSSGHCYLKLKDDNAVIDAVIWKGSMGKLPVRPEDGMEVVVTGRLTTYPQRSSYQLIIESLDLAGQGALLKLLEDRRRRLQAEGLFDPARKRPLPYLPRRIGVVTSPTGAVIRDILHRLNDRFPLPVLVWPVAVQGEGCAAQVAAAIAGFNALSDELRPDVIIVARGGGSLEDLMGFNDEAVVRAVAASLIPLISAVGHETDTTLCDYAADLRAPTPTAAAELAVPVRLELVATVQGRGARLIAGVVRALKDGEDRLASLVRGLPPLERLIEERQQRVDGAGERLATAMGGRLTNAALTLAGLVAALRSPREQVAAKSQELGQWQARLLVAMQGRVRAMDERSGSLATRLQPALLTREMDQRRINLGQWQTRLTEAMARGQHARETAVLASGERLEANSHTAILARGFALVRDEQGRVVDSVSPATVGAAWQVTFKDGSVAVRVDRPNPPATTPKTRHDGAQGRMF